jgi:flagellar biosynthesis protein FlhF
VPLQVADLATLRDCIGDDDLTLIDTAGRSPRDVDAIAELASAIGDLPLEVHLVVPAGSSAQAIDALVLRYRALRPVRLLFTKLDEVESAPELSRAPARLELPITWITTGQAVPEDIEEPTSARVLELASTGLSNRTRNRNRAA